MTTACRDGQVKEVAAIFLSDWANYFIHSFIERPVDQLAIVNVSECHSNKNIILQLNLSTLLIKF